MDSGGSTASSKDVPLPLASLRLLVPPLQLMTASMWQVVRAQDVGNYWEVAEFVRLALDAAPELLARKHAAQLSLGLRARYIVELCRDDSAEPDVALSYLDKMKSQHPSKMGEIEEQEAMDHFLELIKNLLKDPEEREAFFLEDFPVVFGAQYASDLHTLFGEFLCRLAQLLPVPDLEQTVSWLGAECSALEDCARPLSKPTDLRTLLRHHKHHGHLEEHVPRPSMGNSIMSSLFAKPLSREAKGAGRSKHSDSLQVLGVGTQAGSYADDVAVEIIAVTDYPEVELGASTEIEIIVGEECYDGTDSTGTVTQEGATREEKAETAQENVAVIHPETNKDQVSALAQLRVSVGPHDCPDCEKKFKFASSLTAHRVIHTGERPHRCGECGRCFSFRQSLDRHRHTHGAGRRYDCFRSPTARAEHKQTNVTNETTESGREVVICDSNGSGAPAEVVRPTCPDQAGGDGGPHSPDARCSVRPPSEAGGFHKEAPSVATVRTSGRKRKPTMKIQVINFQKQMASKIGKELSTARPPKLKPLPTACAEHSYGSPVDKDSEENGSSAAFSCPKCSFRRSEEAQVQRHIDSVHSVQMEEDGLRSQPPEDQAQQLIHGGEQPFACCQCGRRFSFKQSLERHKQTHKPGRTYGCLICGEFFRSPVAQREHQSTHMKNGEYLCSECGRTFAWKSALVRHLKTHGDASDKLERLYKCPRCDLSFSCSSYLSRHLQTHQETKEHTCNCGKSFAYRAALTAHQRIHQKDRPHACPQCGKGFLYKGGLLSHMKIHSEEMPFMCSYCGKSFKRERNMKKHERCHTRENVFRCSQCDKSFVYKATLVRHELTHSGVRPYLCSDCGKGFFSHAELLKHERFHTGRKPFRCPHCGKEFTQSCYLTIHLRYHTGARPYSCDECDKSFLSANRLKRHQRTHSGERPYLCVECGKGFRQSYNLKMHQRTHAMK